MYKGIDGHLSLSIGEGSGTTMWDATQYLRFGGERARPFFDLLARVGAELPEHVVDMGCGPGNLTVLLAERWPSAAVCGVDSSPQMIEAARKLIPADAPRSTGSGSVLTSHAPGLSFMLDDVRHWEPQSLPDVITPTRCCSGCPAIASCSSAGRTGWPTTAGWRSRSRETSISRRT